MKNEKIKCPITLGEYEKIKKEESKNINNKILEFKEDIKEIKILIEELYKSLK